MTRRVKIMLNNGPNGLDAAPNRRAKVSGWWGLLLFCLMMCCPSVALAVDPPHPSNNCGACHIAHHAPGANLNTVAGNPNLCQSCHVAGGLASAKALPNSVEAMPWPGLPANTNATGKSHRWDSGAAGHVKFLGGAATPSTGTLLPSGTFTGRYAKTFTLTITTNGSAGSARFNWTATTPGGGSGTGLLTGTNVLLDEGVSVTFRNSSNTSFQANDRWNLYVRTDLRWPTHRELAIRVSNGSIMCSTCHNQHSQTNAPFDPTAPAYGGAGTGAGRHYQRIPNDSAQMCVDCHSARNVASSAGGSHPVGLTVPTQGRFQPPTNVPLDQSGRVWCMTCHQPHFSPINDGTLLRITNRLTLCIECHTLGDTTTPASHFRPADGAQWPGGQYGSTFPAKPDTTQRGTCVNCHHPHGWPDASSPSTDYPKLLVEFEENLCLTCHDGSPATTNIRGEFFKASNTTNIYHHPVADSEQVVGRSVECTDCHNPHQGTHANRNKGTIGIDLAGNPVGPGTANGREVVQYELCFKCHGDTFNSSRPATTNKRLDFQTNNSAFHPVVTVGRNQSANLARQLHGGLSTNSTLKCIDCHNNEATANALGLASNSSASPQGPHGSTNAAIRRAFYSTTLTGPSNWNRNNFALCHLCHNPQRLAEARRWDDGAASNFYDDIDGKDNLHWVHLVDRADKSRATCKNCHYNVHSNVAANNTQYNIDGTVYTTPPQNTKTHLINFSPDIQPIGGRAKPEWRINTTTRQRQCNLSCHSYTMSGYQYRPASGDDTPTIP